MYPEGTWIATGGIDCGRHFNRLDGCNSLGGLASRPKQSEAVWTTHGIKTLQYLRNALATLRWEGSGGGRSRVQSRLEDSV